MGQVESPEGDPAESYHARVQGESAIVAESREIDDFDPILFRSPSPLARFGLYVRPVELAKPQVNSQHGHPMPPLSEPSGEGGHLCDRSTLLLEGIVSLNHL